MADPTGGCAGSIMAAKKSCREWSEAIGRSTFKKEHAGRVVYLAIDEEEIGEIGLGAWNLEREEAKQSFRAAVIKEVDYGWPEAHTPKKGGDFPVYLAILAAQVVAASQMRKNEQAPIHAYWARLRQFLGQSCEPKLPDKLTYEVHNALWNGIDYWANKTLGGEFGKVRLAKSVQQNPANNALAQILMQAKVRSA